MKHHDNDEAIYEAAREAINADGLARVLELAAGENGCDDEAVAALYEVTTDTLVADAVAAAATAGWRGRLPTGDDVGDAAERRRSCCEGDQSGQATIPFSLKGVW